MIFSGMSHLVAFTSLLILWYFTPNFLGYWISRAAQGASFLYASFLLGSLYDSLPRFRVSAKNKAVLITGCDTGFGHLLAHRLDSIGYKVFAGCLRSTGSDVERLRDSCSQRMTIFQIDVTDNNSVSQAVRLVEEQLQDCELWAVVNNAGVIVRGELEWTSLEDYQKQFQVNTFGMVRVTQAFLPLLRRFKGRLVATTSFGGRFTFPGLASYCMSKHAANSFCDGLRMEMEKFSVKVITVEPFSYQSPMTDMSTVLESADDTWSRASQTIKTEYGFEYIDSFKQSLQKFNESSANPNIHEVVDSLVEAVTVTSPHYRYIVGDFKSLALGFCLNKMPLWMAYGFVKKFVTFDDDASPKPSRKNRKKA